MRGDRRAVNVGKLDTRLLIARATESQSATGAVSKVWTTLDTVWGGVRFLRSREREDAGQVFDSAEVSITIRTGGEGGKVHQSDRIVRVSDSELFEIKGVAPFPANRPRWIEITASVRQDKVAAATATNLLDGEGNPILDGDGNPILVF